MSSCVAVGERCRKINCSCSDILLISLLDVEIDDIVDRAKMRVLVVSCCGVFDVAK